MRTHERLKIGGVLSLSFLLAFLLVPRPGCQAFSQRATDRTQEIGQLAKQAANDLHDQKPVEAAAEYRKLLEIDPDNLEAHSNLGLAYYLQGNYAQAASEFEIALHRKPDLWNIAALCGLSEAQMGRNAVAVIRLSDAFDKVHEPTLRMATGRQLFSLLMEAGDLDRAALVIGQMHKIDPANLDVLYAEHQVYALQANKAFVSLAQLAPDSARMYELQGDEMLQDRDVPGAIAAYRLAIQRDPHLSGVHYALGEALSASNSPADQAQAEGEYRNALADNPRDEKADCRLGEIELKRSNLQAAALDLRRAVQLQPDDPDANGGMGEVLMESGSNLEAVTYLQRAVRADPYDEIAYYRLSLASRKAGDPNAAAQAMNEFLNLKAKKDQMESNFRNLLVKAMQLNKDRKPTPSAANPNKASGSPND
jgi:tetratricopeptide (TPR) repeat protein